METTANYTGLWFAYPTAAEIVSAGAVFIFLNFLAVGSRFYTRKMQKQDISADDWLTIPALILIIGMNICLFYGIAQKSIGYPSPPDNINIFTGDVSLQESLIAQLSVPFTLMMIVAYGCIKLSALFFYRRLFVTSWRTPFGITCKISIVIIICWIIGAFFGYGLGCGTHPDAIWGNIYDTIKYCPRSFTAELALFVSDLITDVLVLILPLPVIWSLQMSLGKKLSVTAVLLLGGMALAASITRIAIYLEIAERGFDLTEDINLASSTTLYWSSIEAGLGLFAVCLPSLRPLFMSKSPLSSIWNSLLRTIPIHSSWRSIDSSRISRERPNIQSLGTYHEVRTLNPAWAESEAAIRRPDRTHAMELKALRDHEGARVNRSNVSGDCVV